MSLEHYAMDLLAQPGFAERFDREHGTNLAQRGNAMERLIYQVGGGLQRDFEVLLDYAADTIWRPDEDEAA